MKTTTDMIATMMYLAFLGCIMLIMVVGAIDNNSNAIICKQTCLDNDMNDSREFLTERTEWYRIEGTLTHCKCYTIEDRKLTEYYIEVNNYE